MVTPPLPRRSSGSGYLPLSSTLEGITSALIDTPAAAAAVSAATAGVGVVSTAHRDLGDSRYEVVPALTAVMVTHSIVFVGQGFYCSIFLLRCHHSLGCCVSFGCCGKF